MVAVDVIDPVVGKIIEIGDILFPSSNFGVTGNFGIGLLDFSIKYSKQGGIVV